MAYAHDHNIIHRDLKPANVIIGDFGETIVIDWGLAKDLRVAEESKRNANQDRIPGADDLTTVGGILGTPAYMAPEQERGEDVDQRADVFAIGAMLWELCSLHRVPPTEARQRHRMLRSAGIDPDLITILEKTLERDRMRRYPHAGALAADLRAFKAGARISARRYSMFAVLRHWMRRHRALTFSLAAFAALLVTSVIALAMLYRSSRNSEHRANDALVESWVQRGQQELFTGEYIRALPYLARAYQAGEHSFAVRAMLHRAITLADQKRFRLSGSVGNAQFRKGGREAIVVGSAGDAILLDTISGRVVARLSDPQSSIPKFHPGDVSRDGAIAAIASEDGITIWDGHSSRSIAQRKISITRNTRLVFVGIRQIAIVDTSTITMLSVMDGNVLSSQSLPGFVKDFMALDDHLLVLTSSSMLSAAGSRAELKALLVSNSGIADLGPAEWIDTTVDNRIVLGHSRNVVVRDETGKSEYNYDIANTHLTATTGDRIAFALSSGVIEVLERSGRRVALLTGNAGSLTWITFSHDGKYLVSVGQDGYTRIWDVVQSSELFHYVGLEGFPKWVHADPDAKRILVTTPTSVQLYPFDDPSTLLSIDLPEEVGTARFIAGGSRIFTTADTGVGVWDATTGNRLEYIPAKVAISAHVDSDLRMAAITTVEKSIPVEVRELKDGTLHAKIHSQSAIYGVSFDRNGTKIATSNEAGQIEIWTTEGVRLAEIQAHHANILQIDFSYDNKMLLSGSHDHTAAIWEVASNREIGRVRQQDMIWAARFDPTGSRFATGGSDKYVVLWDTRTFLPIRTFEHEASVRAVGLDEKLLAGGTLANTIQLWDISSGREVSRYHHAGIVQSLDFDHDRMLSTGLDGRIVIWDVSTSVGTPQDVTALVCRLLKGNYLSALSLLQCPEQRRTSPGR